MRYGPSDQRRRQVIGYRRTWFAGGPMKYGIAALLTVIAILASNLPLAAHHSFAAQFDRDKPITLKGTVTRLEWANPHVYFYMDVKGANGVTDNWAIEG